MGRIIGIFLGMATPHPPSNRDHQKSYMFSREIPYKILQQETTPKVSPTKNDDASWLEGGTQGRSVYYTARFIFCFAIPLPVALSLLQNWKSWGRFQLHWKSVKNLGSCF